MLSEPQADAILKDWRSKQWYYSIEICPGVYTKGFEFNNIALTRQMLANVDVKGRRVIDISAMEGTISTEMAKQGATVMSTDAIDRTPQITLVKAAHGVEFDYFPDVPLHRLAEYIFEVQASKSYSHGATIGPSAQTPFGFDVVVSSGVMYHVMNPVDHFMTYRKLCKLGGVVILETAACISDNVSFVHAMRPTGTLYNGYATWFMTTAAIDLFLRASYLEPLAFGFVSREKVADIEIARVGVLSRAIEAPAFRAGSYARFDEVFRSELYNNKDFSMLAPSALLTGNVSRPLDIRAEGLNLVKEGLTVARIDGAESLRYTERDVRLSL